jgi:UDP-N-acetylmuramate--alanine ligase
MPDRAKIEEPFSFQLIHGKKPVVYMIGIGGIGMSALAKFFRSRGARVSGYDKTPTPLTREMEANGIAIHYEEQVDSIPKQVDLVVYTPAIPADHEELVFYRHHGYKLMKRSDVLQLVTASSFNICVAGTHGKTTITTMIAHILRDAGLGCNAFLGGISVNYGANFWSSERNICVVEADEYDRSFLKLCPDIAVVTSMDADHLDIYGTAESMEQAFIDFTRRLQPGGLLVRQFGLKRGKELHGRQVKYSLQNDAADAYATDIRTEEGSYYFNVRLADRSIEGLTLHMGGMHNVENAVAAIAVASSLDIGDEAIRKAISGFRGVKRRFEYIIKNDRIVFIDDYAHHPEELRALINSARSLFRQRKVTVIFQPHLYTRTRDLAEGFAEALDLADEVVLLPVYPARELPLEGVDSEMILEKIKRDQKWVMNKGDLLEWIHGHYMKNVNREFGSILVMAGAGDIDMLVEPVSRMLKDL